MHTEPVTEYQKLNNFESMHISYVSIHDTFRSIPVAEYQNLNNYESIHNTYVSIHETFRSNKLQFQNDANYHESMHSSYVSMHDIFSEAINSIYRMMQSDMYRCIIRMYRCMT